MTTRSPIPPVALVHDYFVQDGGAESVAVELAKMFPEARVHTSSFDRRRFGSRIDPARVRTWPLQRIVPPPRWFRALLPAYVLHFSRLEVPADRLVISSSSTFARAVHVQPSARHVAYVHTPLRFAWEIDAYLDGLSVPLVGRAGLRLAAPALRRWDRRAGRRPDVLVANSRHIQRQIRRIWGRDSTVIYPPVDVAGTCVASQDDGYYLIATRLVAHKHVDRAIQACTRLGRELLVVGEGPERPRLERMAGPRTRFTGYVGRSELRRIFASCHALIAPGREDFGIAAVEAMAVGKPVVSPAVGGALETVVDGQSGILYESPTANGLVEAIERLESTPLSPAAGRERAMDFDTSRFHERWAALLADQGLGDLVAFGTHA